MDPFKKIVDTATNYRDDDEEFYEERLARYDGDRDRWATAIDRAAYDVLDGIAIGSTDSKSDLGGTIGATDFPRATGSYYVEGLQALADADSRLEDLLAEYDAEDVGRLVIRLTQLRQKLKQEAAEDLDPETLSKTLEALVEKLTTKEVESGGLRQSLRDTEAVVDMVLQLFSDPAVEEYADALVDETSRAAKSKSILSLVDDPQLTTPLWDHQLRALRNWVQNDRRGYVNMATATGKTVLGLAAISQRFDGLHPADESEELSPETAVSLDGDLRVLIVAGRNLLLEQWRGEFEDHLNIPIHRTKAHETDTGREIRLSWGTIEFQTSQQLASNQVMPEYDLVILDEAHRYSKGSSTSRGWRDIFENLTTKSDDILAMSGSIDAGWIGDETVENVLEEELKEVATFGLPEAREAGVIADFEWNISYVPAAGREAVQKLIDVTTTCAQYFDSVGGPDLRPFGDSVSDADVWTLKDLRSFANTTTGRELREQNEEFDTLANAAFSRSTQRWQLGPTVESIVDILREHRGEKSVVLVQSYAFAEVVELRLEEAGLREELVALSDRSAEPKEAIDEFNRGGANVILGPGDLLGTGIDLPDAEVAINVGKGGINSSLVQRIGRVLRNPTGEKNATFYHLVSVPTDRRATIFHEDGRRLLKRVSSFALLGERMQEVPHFQCRDPDLREIVEELETEGTRSYRELPYDFEEFVNSQKERDRIRDLCERIETTSEDGIVSFKGAGRDEEHVTDETFEWQPESTVGDDSNIEESTGDVEGTADSTQRVQDSVDDLPDDLSEEQLQQVIDIARLEPIPDDEVVDLWGLESRRDLAVITVVELDDYLTRNEEGHVCTTAEGRGLYERLGDAGKDDTEDEPTSDTKSETHEGEGTDPNPEAKDREYDDEDSTGDTTKQVSTGRNLSISDPPTALVEQVQAEFGFGETTARRLLDLHAETKPIAVKRLVDGWGFEEPPEVYEYLNRKASGLSRIVGLGDVKLADDTRERIDSFADRSDSESDSELTNTISSVEERGVEERGDDTPSDQSTTGRETGDSDDREPIDERSYEEDEPEPSTTTIAGHYSQLLETDHEFLLDELQRIGDHALYPPTEQVAVNETRVPFGSYVFEFGSYADALSAAGYQVNNRGLVDDQDREYRPSEVVAIAQILADLFGGPPTETEFERCSSVTSESVSPIGTWLQVITEAGLDKDRLSDDAPSNREPSSETLSEAIGDVMAELERPPTPPELRDRGDVSPGCVVDTFGSWDRAIERSSPEGQVDQDVREEVVLDGCSTATIRFHQFVERVDESTPTYDRLLKLLPEIDLLSVLDSRFEAQQIEKLEHDTAVGANPDGETGIVADRDESANQQKQIVVGDRVQPEFDLDEESELKDDLYRLNREFGHPPRPVDVENYGRFSPTDYAEVFGTWTRVLSEVGLNFEAAWIDEEDHDDELIEVLCEAADLVAHRPTTRNIDELTDYTATSYVSRWGSIENAIERTGIDAKPNTMITEIVDAGAESWDVVHDFDEEKRIRASREALLLLKRGWTGTGYEIVGAVETRIDVETLSYRSMWEETLQPILTEAESHGLVERDESGRTWTWVAKTDN